MNNETFDKNQEKSTEDSDLIQKTEVKVIEKQEEVVYEFTTELIPERNIAVEKTKQNPLKRIVSININLPLGDKSNREKIK